jgi:hypothetical protein
MAATVKKPKQKAMKKPITGFLPCIATSKGTSETHANPDISWAGKANTNKTPEMTGAKKNKPVFMALCFTAHPSSGNL